MAQAMNPTVFRTTNVTGVLLAIACFEHGLFEALQGFERTPGYIIQAIGEDIRWWSGGTEEAFTLIPNYFVTGIVVMSLSIFAAMWSVKYISSRSGSTVFLLSFVLLTMVGGGIGHVPFYLMVWAFTTRGKSSLAWWSKRITKRNGVERVSLLWKIVLCLAALFWLIAIEIAIFGYFPAVEDEDGLLAISWVSLLMAFIATVAAYIAAMTIDVKKRLDVLEEAT